MGSESQGRRFARTREDFTCERCGARVRGNGYTDHCPRCLWGRHVDVNPGDRAERCGGMMKPIHVVYAHGIYTITYKCERCRAERRFKAAQDDDQRRLEALVAKG